MEIPCLLIISQEVATLLYQVSALRIEVLLGWDGLLGFMQTIKLELLTPNSNL